MSDASPGRRDPPTPCSPDPERRRLRLDGGAPTRLGITFHLTTKTGLTPERVGGHRATNPRRGRLSGGVLGETEKHRDAGRPRPLDDLAARPDDDFADVAVDDDGTQERHLPLRNAGEVKAAAWFSRHRDAFPDAGDARLALWKAPGPIPVCAAGG